MKILLQRVMQARVSVEDGELASIERGLLIFIGIERDDSQTDACRLAEKTAALRIFQDDHGKSNLSLKDVRGQALVVSQFTLAADLSRGNRPSFDSAAKPEEAIPLIKQYVESLLANGIPVKQGQFGAHMAVELINDGPVTYFLNS